jgi:hypothetical protein
MRVGAQMSCNCGGYKHHLYREERRGGDPEARWGLFELRRTAEVLPFAFRPEYLKGR